MDLRLDHVGERLRRKVPLLPTPPSTFPPVQQQQQQQQQSTRKRPTALLTTPSTSTHTTGEHSQHPQFTQMVTYLNVLIRLMFGFDNWKASFPQRLATSLDNFVQSIQPPRRTNSCTHRLQQASREYKDNITNIITSEIVSSAFEYLRLLRQIRAKVNDWRLARDTAERQLKRSHKHLSPSTTQLTLTTLMAFALDPSSAPLEELIHKHLPFITPPRSTDINNTSDSQFIILSTTDTNNTSDTQFVTLSSTAADNTSDNQYIIISTADITTPETSAQPTTSTAVLPPPSAASAAAASPTATPADNRSSLYEITISMDEEEPSDLASIPPTTSTPVQAAVNKSLYPDQPSIDDIILHHSSEEEEVTDPAADPPTFIVPRTSPLSASDLRRQPSSTPLASSSTVLPPVVHTPTPPLPQRLRPRLNHKTISSKQHPSAPVIYTHRPTISGSTTGGHNIRSFRYEEKEQWSITSKPTDAIDTLVIADSNGKRWNDAPSNWIIYSFGGMKLADVSRIMAAAPQILTFKYIIVHCGRNDSYLSVKGNVFNFVNALQAFSHPRLIIVPSLVDPQLHEPGLRLFHNVIKDEFGDKAIIHDEPQFYHRLQALDTKHYSRITARHLIQVIIHCLN
ncbi:hypothetical protein HC928_14130 [bacterium]|nr:hypothetical protein [bacterium]